MKISLKGATVGLAGKVKGYSKKAVGEQVSKWGGNMSSKSNPHKGMDLLLLGQNGSDGKVHLAIVYGVTVVRDEALLELLDKGFVAVDEDEGKRSFDELIGPIRALLASALTEESWLELTGYVDGCKAEDMPKLLAYLKPQIDVKAQRYEENLLPYDFEAAGLCALPPMWLLSAMSGEAHEKFKLCHAITYTRVRVGSTPATKVFDLDTLSHITTFDTGYVNEEHMKKKTFYKKMGEASNLQNVRRLVLGYDRAHAFAELLHATSLPNVEEIWLRRDMRDFEAFHSGADMYFGPWAGQLVTVGASSARHLEVLSERIEELPAVEHLALLFAYVHDRERMAPFIAALPGLMPHIKRLSLCMAGHMSTEYPYYNGIGEVLDVISEHDLETLDLRGCSRTRLEGEVGESFVQKHFMDNGLASRLGTLFVHEHISLALCDMLRAQGVDVQVPAKVEIKAKAPAFKHIKEMSGEELERQANGRVHVHDAMRFDEPCAEAWEVLVGVVNALELRCSGAEFAEAIATLSDHLEQWPDDYRELPTAWYKALFDEVPSPKLDLVRRLRLSLRYGGISSDMKCASRWFTRLSCAPHIDRISMFDIEGYGGQKHVHEAILALVRSMKPAVLRLSSMDKHRDVLCALLEAHDVLPECRETGYVPRKRNKGVPMDDYDARHIVHKISTPAELQQVLARRDLDHIVSLDLEIDSYGGFSSARDLSSMQIEPASFGSLKYMNIHAPSRMAPFFRGVFLEWVQHARPICVMNNMDTLATMIRAGLYERGFGSAVKILNRQTLDELKACVSDTRFHAFRLGAYAPYGNEPSCASQLIVHMHEGLRACLRELSWETELAEWPDLDGACAQLPNLSMLSLFNPAFMSAESRAPYLHAFKEMTHLHALSCVRVLADTSRKHAPFTAKEIKPLYKVSHAAAEVLCIQGKP